MNARLAAKHPTVGKRSGSGELLPRGLLPKLPSALAVTEYRPVSKLRTKLILLDGINNNRLMNTIEHSQLIDDVQEDFRWHRSGEKRELSKNHGILANQQRRKSSQ